MVWYLYKQTNRENDMDILESVSHRDNLERLGITEFFVEHTCLTDGSDVYDVVASDGYNNIHIVAALDLDHATTLADSFNLLLANSQ